MKIKAACALLLTLISVPAIAQNPWGLPEDFNKWYLTVVYSDNMNENDSALYHFMRSDLDQFRSTSVFNEYQTSHETISGTAWKQFLGDARPCILLQGLPQPDGSAEVIYYKNGITPADLEGLRDDLFQSVRNRTAVSNGCSYVFQRDCPGGVCPRPFRRRPAPVAPQPAPPTIIPIYPTVPPQSPAPAPPVVEPLASEDEGRPAWHYLLPLAAAGLALWGTQSRDSQ